ncbi:hypothetical protein EG329_004261 [Mollisiaceae sp. DMI_Dod_QoI]|nr:hypothetical protein EG329_004261 [Helotiales sp. DMI_Dod_QoI]
MASTQSQRKLRVGVIGAGEVAQVIHLPTLALLNHLYSVVSICDISRQTVDHVAAKFDVPHKTINPSETIYHPDADLIMILTADEFHEILCISAISAGKLVFIEKPITLSIPSVERILEAEKAAGGNKIFVGYMRRHASSFTQVFLREVASIPRILYARSRDIVGRNSHFVSQSGTTPVKFTDFPANAAQERKALADKLIAEAFPNRAASKREIQYCRFLGSLGSHDLSLMREALGFPESVAGVSANEPFYSAIFNYRNKTGEPYSVTYESGIDSVPRFDANLAVYGERKTVSIQYDTPYIKGLPIKVRVDEFNETGEATSREILSSFEDAYTVELKEVYECFVNGKTIKTTAADASMELKFV